MNEEKESIEKNRHYFILNNVLLVFLFIIIALDWMSTVLFLKFPIFEEANVIMAPIIKSGNWFLIALCLYYSGMFVFLISNYIMWRMKKIYFLKLILLLIIFMSSIRMYVVLYNLFTVILYV